MGALAWSLLRGCGCCEELGEGEPSASLVGDRGGTPHCDINERTAKFQASVLLSFQGGQLPCDARRACQMARSLSESRDSPRDRAMMCCRRW
jgi:hypothetical protein